MNLDSIFLSLKGSSLISFLHAILSRRAEVIDRYIVSIRGPPVADLN